jgi:RNA-splicing ligase RtcB
MKSMINGKTLLDWGFEQAPWFKTGIERANALRTVGKSDTEIKFELTKLIPEKIPEIPMRTNSIPFSVFLDAETDHEKENLNSVTAHMDALMRTPTIQAGAVMPDACPVGSTLGTIPVGGVVACEDAIHPGFHSADICCSMAISIFKRDESIGVVMDALEKITHFGKGGRARSAGLWKNLPVELKDMHENKYLHGLEEYSMMHFGTQGDGNHFAYVGHLKSTGSLALVTHHGSRGFGAALYKRGMAAAQKHTKIHAPRTPMHNAWIKADSEDGQAYWEALQYIETWTRGNHFIIHDLLSKKLGNRVTDRFFNPHNFVFQKSDGMFYHAKGATPSYDGYGQYDTGLTLIPMNMAEPILITKHTNKQDALGFAPHGAGRNMSRTQFLNNHKPELPKDIDVRFFCGNIDRSELPEAYKSAATVKAQIAKYGLANVYDEVLPGGSMMAGEFKNNYFKKKKVKAEADVD